MTKNKKKIIICLVIIFIIFAIIMIYIIANKSKDNLNLDEPIPDDYYAVNETKSKSKVDEKTEQTNTKVINNVTFDNLNKLNHEQTADKNSLFTLVLNSVKSEEALYGKVTDVKILDYSDSGLIYLSVTFKNNTNQTYVSVYDDYTTHSFLNCVPLEKWELYHSDKNKG